MNKRTINDTIVIRGNEYSFNGYWNEYKKRHNQMPMIVALMGGKLCWEVCSDSALKNLLEYNRV